MDFDSMSVEKIWELIDCKANEHPEYIKDINASYTIELTGDASEKYGLTFYDGKAEVIEGGIVDANCSLIMSVKNFKKILQGNLNAATAFMTGRLRVKGDLNLALTLESLLKKYSIEMNER